MKGCHKSQDVIPVTLKKGGRALHIVRRIIAGVEVEMFGATRLLPAGPAYLSLVTGTPLSVASVNLSPLAVVISTTL